MPHCDVSMRGAERVDARDAFVLGGLDRRDSTVSPAAQILVTSQAGQRQSPVGPATISMQDQPKSESSRLMSRIVGYGISRTAVEGMLAGRGLLLAGILGPELFGVWALFRIYLRYLSFAGLGLLRGLEFEVSRSGREPTDGPSDEVLWGRVAAGHTLLLYGVLSALAALVWAWVAPSERLADMALLGIAVGLLLDRYWNYGITFLRASDGLRRFAILEFLQAAVQVIACLLLALRWGLPGAFAGFAIANLAGITLLSGRAPLIPRFELRRIYQLIKIGFPVSLMGILTATLTTVDRLLVGAIMGLGGLGVYAFAVSISDLGVSFAAVVRTVILRDVYKESSPESEAEPFALDRALSGYATFGPPLAGVLGLVLPFLITLVPGDYDSAAPVAQLLLFAGLIQGLTNVAVLGIVAGGRQGRLPLLSGAAVVLNAFLTLSALAIGLGLQGVAIAAILTRSIHAAVVVALLVREASARAVVMAVIRFLAPSIWCATAVYTISHLLPADDMTTLLLELFVYAIAIALLSTAIFLARRAHRAP
jgi:O-antigen/teichoic acid export membrane protein